MWGGRLGDLDDGCKEGCLVFDHIHGGMNGGGDVVGCNAGVEGFEFDVGPPGVG